MKYPCKIKLAPTEMIKLRTKIRTKKCMDIRDRLVFRFWEEATKKACNFLLLINGRKLTN